MKLLRFGNPGEEKPGIEKADGTRVDCSAFGEDWTEDFLDKDGLNRLNTWLVSNENNCLAIPEGTRLGPPIKRPSKIIWVKLFATCQRKRYGSP